ncbi:MAG: hypothetical protein CALGDGBN_00872 [Pseudomonadales bacterium]|nr:hypothetical protein [Pseudomonadales bacterium]
MPNRRRQLPALLRILKAQLRAAGLRQQDVADRLGVGVSTVKRWLGGGGLDASRLEDLCELAGLSLAELVELATTEQPGKLVHFTPHQEEMLARDQRLFILFFALLNGRTRAQCTLELRVAGSELDRLLETLAHLGLIRLLPGGQMRVLAERWIAWRPTGPLARQFKLRRSFLDQRVPDEDALYMPDFFPLSARGVGNVRLLCEQFRRDLHRIAEVDQNSAGERTRWHGTVFLLRPLDMTPIRAAFETPSADS